MNFKLLSTRVFFKGQSSEGKKYWYFYINLFPRKVTYPTGYHYGRPYFELCLHPKQWFITINKKRWSWSCTNSI